ncbi:hypothetical protein [Neptuniibacter sp. CAU 1671]|uniref:hypothetical protein n=1 Tax=Neptuniibacter sp. CAU 1671 TaxID=3032593 RepID=UPI0023DB03D0|nr:hypothetical protein [Neptuniibacter sp. CAU 1671]MDF2180919.1 hypothetical protein [Neptuniibacter sp. CAU 1671]
MTEEQLLSRLSDLSLEQLDELEQQLLRKVEAKKHQKQSLSRLPPRSGTDLEAMASELGLDISRLMKDAKKHSR